MPNPQPGGSGFYIGVYCPGAHFPSDSTEVYPALVILLVVTLSLAEVPAFSNHSFLPAWLYMGLHKGIVPCGGGT